MLLLAVILAAVLVVALAITVAGVHDDTEAEPQGRRTDAQTWPERSSFTWLVASRFLVSMGLYLIVPFFVDFLRFALHVQAYLQTNLDLLLAIVGFSLVGTLPAYLLGDRVSKKATMTAALALLAIGAFVLAHFTSIDRIAIIAGVLGIGWGAYYAVDWALACNLLPPGRAGALMAIWNIGASGPQVLSPMIGGPIADRIGAAAHDPGAGYRVLFELVSAYVVVGIIALAFVRERQGRESAG